MSRIRPIAIGLIRRGNALLAIRWTDDVKGEAFYRPIGGGIEFRERGADALAREFREEIGAELTSIRFLYVLENLFTYQGRDLHEIVLCFEAALADATLYDRDVIHGIEGNGVPFEAHWVPRDDILSRRVAFYPDRLVERLGEEA